jgi:hypothetical protein
MQQVNTLRTFSQTFLEPSKAYEAIFQKHSLWFPMVAITLASLIFMMVYATGVDPVWFLDDMINITLQQTPDADVSMMKGEGVFYAMIGGLFGAVVLGIPLMFVLQALYFFLVSKFSSKEMTFVSALALVAWASLPLIVDTLAALSNFLTSDGQVGMADINILSLSSMLGLTVADPWFTLASKFTVGTIWSWGLMTIGYKQFAKISTGKAALTVLAPYVVMYGAMAAFV